ncbi:Calcium/calmodulin-dependent protein kinase type I [Coemansia sp. RSA 2618]|nr:Calcium/calmodulin-dependent protein kinase type I [Coemansia sp. RSA 2618]
MEAAYVIKQIVSGVAYIHKQGFVHRDIKTENCLIRTDQSGVPISIAIADFGMAYYMGNRPENSIVTEKCGTPGYMAPEMLTRSGYGKAIDMWAIGVITYFILSGTTPFQRGAKAHMSGSAGFGQTMPEEALGLGMIPECGFPEELAEQLAQLV